MSLFVAVAFSAVLAGLRIAGHKSQAYQAVAHLWVGGLIGYAIPTHSADAIGLAGALSLIELAVFLRDKLPTK